MPNINVRRRIINKSSVTTFSPPDFINLRLWLDAMDISTLDTDFPITTPVTQNGDPVGSIGDKSGNGFDFVQQNTTKKSTYRDTGLLSPTLEFDGIDDFYFGDPTTWGMLLDGDDDFSFFSALKPNNTNLSKGILFASSNNLLSIHTPLDSTRIRVQPVTLFNVAVIQTPPFVYSSIVSNIDPLLNTSATSYINNTHRLPSSLR